MKNLSGLFIMMQFLNTHDFVSTISAACAIQSIPTDLDRSLGDPTRFKIWIVILTILHKGKNINQLVYSVEMMVRRSNYYEIETICLNPIILLKKISLTSNLLGKCTI